MSQFLVPLVALTLTFPAAVAAQPAPSPAPDAAQTSSEEGATPHSDPSEDLFWQAVAGLQSTRPEELAAARQALQNASDQEFIHAQTLLANCLVSGSYGFPKNARKGANLFQLAAERGNGFAMVSLGQCYITGTGLRRNEGKAEEWLQKALAPEADYSRLQPPQTLATAGGSELAGQLASDPVAMAQATAHFFLGQIRAKKNDAAAAHRHFEAAARAGDGGREGIQQAAVQAAFNYAFGLGTARDLTKANDMLEQSKRLIARESAAIIHNNVAIKLVDEFAAADLEETTLNESEALQQQLRLMIANTLADKKSKEFNPAEAAKWYELAAENDQAWAMIALAFLHARGDLGRPDPEAAFSWFERAGGGENPKHLLATVNLALCHLHGYGTARDEVRAKEIFSEYRDHHIVAYLGTEGRAPEGILDYEQCLKLLESTARRDPHGQYLMGRRFDEAWEGERDLKAAERWLKRAVKAGHTGAMVQLGVLYENQALALGHSPDKALHDAANLYRDAAEAGNAYGLANYALLLFRGQVVNRNLTLAEHYYRRSLEIEPKNPFAHNNLGAVYEELAFTQGSSDHRRDMLHHYEQAVALGNGLAAHNLGRLHYEGTLIPQDLRQAYLYFSQAVDLGHTAAHFQLGLMHEEGRGVPVTPSEAAYHYRIAALEGNNEALRRLSQFYLTGKGVTMDLDRAGFWLQRLAQAGSSGGMLALIDIAITQERYDQALRRLRQLSSSSNHQLAGFAYDRLSRCYQHGFGVERDEERARRYFDEAVKRRQPDALTHLALRQIAEGKVEVALANLREASRHSPEAAFYLGQMHFFGTHVSIDQTQAFAYMRLAAARGYAKALYFLAATTYKRVEGAPTLEEALQLAEQAESLGIHEATTLREELEAGRFAPGSIDETTGRARSI